MLTLPNFLSFLRIPLALLLLQGNPMIRAAAIILAMVTDVLDGFLARKYRQTSRLGTLLDPVTDKLFVFVALVVFFQEGRLVWWQVLAFLCRDCSVLLFTLYLALRGELGKYRYGAIWCGKMATALQFLLLVGLALNISVPSYLFILLAFFGFCSFLELYLEGRRQRKQL